MNITHISKGFYSIRIAASSTSLWNRNSNAFWLWNSDAGQWEQTAPMLYLDACHVRRFVTACGKRSIAIPVAVANAVNNGQGVFYIPATKNWL